jgi:hypothetical protein
VTEIAVKRWAARASWADRGHGLAGWFRKEGSGPVHKFDILQK